jgi:hypothetical protein
MKVCSKCSLSKEDKHFVKSKYNDHSRRRSYCYTCKYKEAKPVDKQKASIYGKTYYIKNFKVALIKAYRWTDQQKGFEDTLSKQEFDKLVVLPCFYCEKEKSGGLDRIDNYLGHSISNVRPCCEKCNNILGDLPDEAKLLLKSGLKEINDRELLREWMIPTKRKKKPNL